MTGIIGALVYYLQHPDGMTEIVKQEAAYSIRALANAGVEILQSGTLSDVLYFIRTGIGA